MNQAQREGGRGGQAWRAGGGQCPRVLPGQLPHTCGFGWKPTRGRGRRSGRALGCSSQRGQGPGEGKPSPSFPGDWSALVLTPEKWGVLPTERSNNRIKSRTEGKGGTSVTYVHARPVQGSRGEGPPADSQTPPGAAEERLLAVRHHHREKRLLLHTEHHCRQKHTETHAGGWSLNVRLQGAWDRDFTGRGQGCCFLYEMSNYFNPM